MGEVTNGGGQGLMNAISRINKNAQLPDSSSNSRNSKNDAVYGDAWKTLCVLLAQHALGPVKHRCRLTRLTLASADLSWGAGCFIKAGREAKIVAALKQPKLGVRAR